MVPCYFIILGAFLVGMLTIALTIITLSNPPCSAYALSNDTDGKNSDGDEGTVCAEMPTFLPNPGCNSFCQPLIIRHQRKFTFTHWWECWSVNLARSFRNMCQCWNSENYVKFLLLRKQWVEIGRGKTVNASNAEVCEQRDWLRVAKTGPCPFSESPTHPPATFHLPRCLVGRHFLFFANWIELKASTRYCYF